jgi:hypothetical protein
MVGEMPTVSPSTVWVSIYGYLAVLASRCADILSLALKFIAYQDYRITAEGEFIKPPVSTTEFGTATHLDLGETSTEKGSIVINRTFAEGGRVDGNEVGGGSRESKREDRWVTIHRSE